MNSPELPTFLTNPNPRIYEGGDYVVLDFETTTHDKGAALNPDNSIVLAVWTQYRDGSPVQADGDRGRGSGNEHPYQVRWAGEYGLGELVRAVEESAFLVAHNAKFEIQWLERCGLDLTNVMVYDTMIGEYVIGGNRYVGHQLSLENCAQRRYGEGKSNVISKLFKAGLCSTEIPHSWLEEYCIRDVELTHRLFLDQRKEMGELNLLPIMYTRCLAVPILADIEKNGMQVDAPLVRTRLADVEIAFAKQETKLELMTGGINLNSPQQVGKFLYDDLKFGELMKYRRPIRTPASARFPEGQRKTNADTIMALQATNDKQRLFQQQYKKYKELYSELTKYLRKFADCADHDGGVLHAQFNQTNTKTHRLSSTGTKYSTQFQNFPKAYKPLFRAKNPDWLIGECDGSQLEFRVAVHLGRDSVGLRDITGGADIHNITADIIGCSRDDAKAHTFKPLYGGSSGTDDQRRYYSFFRDKYKGITDTQQRWISEVLATKCLVTEWGMRYYWPTTRMDRSGYVTNTTSICNYPVQALATAEVIPIALVFFWHLSKRMDVEMTIVNTIHDSIVVELPPTEVETFHDLSRQCLIDEVYLYLEKVYDLKLTIPLGCSVSTDSHWGCKIETKYEAEERLYAN